MSGQTLSGPIPEDFVPRRARPPLDKALKFVAVFPIAKTWGALALSDTSSGNVNPGTTVYSDNNSATMKLIRNEQAKLLANALDRASTAFLAVGIVTPMVGVIYNFAGFQATPGLLVVVAGTCAMSFVALFLHLQAHRALKRGLSA